VTLWGRQAETFASDNVGSAILIKGARLSDFGGRTLSVSTVSSMHLNPDCPDAHSVKGWYDSAQGPGGSEDVAKEIMGYSQQGLYILFLFVHFILFILRGISYLSGKLGIVNVGSGFTGGAGASGSVTSAHGMKQFKTVEQIAESHLGLGEKPDWVTLRGTVTFMKDSNLWYPACSSPDCNKKVVEEMDGSGWRCEKCRKTHPNANYRYGVFPFLWCFRVSVNRMFSYV
jgi:replication factor A1